MQPDDKAVTHVLFLPHRRSRRAVLSACLTRLVPLLTRDAASGRVWAVWVMQQTSDGEELSRSRCYNAGATMAAVKYPNVRRFVFSETCVALDAAAITALGGCGHDEAVSAHPLTADGVAVSVDASAFLRSRGFCNMFSGVSCREVRVVEDEFGSIAVAPSVGVLRCTREPGAAAVMDDVKAELCRRWAAQKDNRFGRHELVFAVTRVEQHLNNPIVRTYDVQLYMTLPSGWSMRISSEYARPYYLSDMGALAMPPEGTAIAVAAEEDVDKHSSSPLVKQASAGSAAGAGAGAGAGNAADGRLRLARRASVGEPPSTHFWSAHPPRKTAKMGDKGKSKDGSRDNSKKDKTGRGTKRRIDGTLEGFVA